MKVNKNFMKYLLLIQICASVSGVCSPAMDYPILFDNWADCVYVGVDEASKILKSMNYDVINENMLGPKFECKLITST